MRIAVYYKKNCRPLQYKIELIIRSRDNKDNKLNINFGTNKETHTPTHTHTYTHTQTQLILVTYRYFRELGGFLIVELAIISSIAVMVSSFVPCSDRPTTILDLVCLKNMLYAERARFGLSFVDDSFDVDPRFFTFILILLLVAVLFDLCRGMVVTEPFSTTLLLLLLKLLMILDDTTSSTLICLSLLVSILLLFVLVTVVIFILLFAIVTFRCMYCTVYYAAFRFGLSNV